MKNKARNLAIALLLSALPLAGHAGNLAPLVSADWLHENLDRDDLVVVDIRSEIDGTEEKDFVREHIPGAVYSSYTGAGWRIERDGVPGMLPSVEDLELLIGGLGIGNDTGVVIVSAGEGTSDVGSAARVYWTFKVLGHDRVAILNGGHKAWTAAGHPTDEGRNAPWRADFEADFRPELVASADEVEQARAAGLQLVDNRPEDQFRGRDKHPDARAAGTIPDALNLPEHELLAPETALMADGEALDARLREASVGSGRTITFCNTGHWAALGWFALSELAGRPDVAMYDGSMTDWTQEPERPLATERRGLGRLIDWLTG